MTPSIEQYQIQPQNPQGPDFSSLQNAVDKSFDKPPVQDTRPNMVSGEILDLRDLGNRISNLREQAVSIEAERANSRLAKMAAGFSSVVNKMFGVSNPQAASPEFQSKIKRDILVERESLIGGAVFGAVDHKVTRRFFYDDTAQHQAWFFTETVPQNDGSLHYDKEMRYEIHDNGVLEVARIQDNQNPQGYHYAWQYIDAGEYSKLRLASDLYYQQIVEKIYKPDYDLAA